MASLKNFTEARDRIGPLHNFSIGCRGIFRSDSVGRSVGRLKGRSDERRSIAYIHVLVVIYPFNIGYDLDLASYLVAGPDHNLPLDNGHVGHDGFMKKLLNVVESSQ